MRKLPILVLALAVSVGLLAGSAQAATAHVTSSHAAHVKPNPKCKSKAYLKSHKALCKANAKAVALAKAKAKAAAAAKAKAKSGTSALSFAGKYAGQASTKVTGTNAAIVANGTGTGNLVGAGKVSGTGSADTSQQPCSPFTGTGTITGAKGTISFSVPTGASGCGDDGGHIFTLKGTFTVTGTTGAVAGAKGSLRFTGVYSRDAGTFSINVSGNLTK